jgi:hypothetical protein
VFGFHGCDEDVGLRILNGHERLKPSSNPYDWLGNGVYFWENNYERARQYAVEDSQRAGTNIQKPFIIGAIIDLKLCLDLLDQKWLDFLSLAYGELKKSNDVLGQDLPQNKRFGRNGFDFKKRELDCAVIRYAHRMAGREGIGFDSVRAMFPEERELYDGAGFKLKNHIQIAIINPNCIKGIFLPRTTVPFPEK